MKATAACVGVLVASGCTSLAGIEEKRLRPKPAEVEDRPGRPPSPPLEGPDTFGGTEVWFAVRSLHFGGNVHGSDQLDEHGWRKLGWDLDGAHSTVEQPGEVCRSEAALGDLADGDDARDNVIGAHLFRELAELDPEAEARTNRAIERGGRTLLLQLRAFDDWANDEQVTAALYLSTADSLPGTTPTWDTNDVRLVSSLSYPPGSKLPLVRFDRSYIREGVWVSGEPEGHVDLSIPVLATDERTSALLLRLRGRSGWITAHLNAGAGGPGTLGYTTSKSDIAEAFSDVYARALGCPNDNAAQARVQAHLHRLDTQLSDTDSPDPAEDCDSMSWGIGVQWAPVDRAEYWLPVEESVPVGCLLGG